jgi:DNA-binding NarL/FixJ family response regulator
MYLFQRILYAIRGWFRRDPVKNFNLDIDTLNSLEYVANQEQLTPEAMANQILDDVFQSHEAQEDNWLRWQSLTPREQETAALICLGYTTRQIAAKMHISPLTVKTYVEHIFWKFNVSDRMLLRKMLGGWDFSAWDR